ncbi:hypothetical protein Tco_1353544 [Tanacetum coccineum]
MAPVTRRGPNTPPNNTNPNNITPESVQAMIDQALLRNSTNGDGSHSSHGDNRRNVQTTRPCFYADFMKCQPLNFKGNEGVVGLTWWIEKMESVFNISDKDTLGPDGIFDDLGNDVPTYTERFQELTLICTKFVANKTEKVDKYISGLPNNIYGNVKSSRPKTLDETIKLANDLMDQKTHAPYCGKTKTDKHNDRLMINPENNHAINNNPFKRQNVASVYNMGAGEKKPYGGSLPKCSKCHFHHNGLCTRKCHKYNKGSSQGEWCFECWSSGNFKRDCPKLKNKDGGNGNAQYFLRPGYYAISARRVRKDREGKQLKDIPIVQDFSEVFPEDLSGLPPARPMEFQIDLILGAALVA